jgi:hypothetical protein
VCTLCVYAGAYVICNAGVCNKVCVGTRNTAILVASCIGVFGRKVRATGDLQPQVCLRVLVSVSRWVGGWGGMCV